MSYIRSVVSLSKEFISGNPEKLLKHIRNTSKESRYVDKLVSEPDESNFTSTEVTQLGSIIYESFI
ncbi:MAG: hypothetical protein ACFFC7_25825 [Candidatus Hermodarchaeota archaeon]